MKWWVVGLGIAALPVLTPQGLTPAASQVPNGPILTLDQSIAIAEQNAFSLRAAASSVEKARQRVLQFRGQLGPQLTLSAQDFHTIDQSRTAASGTPASTPPQATTGLTTATTGGTGSSGFSTGSNSEDAALTLTLPLDLTGISKKGIDVAQYAYLASEDSLAAADNDLRLTVKEAYFQVLQAKAQIGVAQETLTNAQARLTNAQEKLTAGTLAKLDVLQFQVQVSQANSDLIAAQNALAVAKESFNNDLGRPIDTPFDVADIQYLPQNTHTAEELINAAEIVRPEIQADRATIESLKATRQVTEGSLYPIVAVGATRAWLLHPGTLNPLFSQNQAFLSVTWPLFDSGVTRAKVKQARQDVAQAEIAYDELKLSVSLEVREALSNLTNSLAQVNVAQAQVDQAREAYRLSIVKFNAGEATTLDVTNAQTQLTQAENGLVNARYNYLRAYAALQRAVDSDGAKGPTLPEPKGLEEKVPTAAGVNPPVPTPANPNVKK